MNLPQLSQDKANHALYCAVICTVLMLVLPAPTAAGITLVVGVAKELIYDWHLKRGTPDWYDMAANAAGVAVPVVAALAPRTS